MIAVACAMNGKETKTSIITIENMGANPNEYVYDISLEGTVVNALGMNILSNTDGFNFQLPKTFRYTEDNPYISNGNGRNSIKGKAYIGVEADVAEFEDTFIHSAFNGGINKMGLGIDEYVPASINFSRKNYADLLDNGKIKLVGNTIKSKKMPLYIERFINRGIDMLLHKRGKDFLDYYYDYIERIYNLRIPLKEIASVGKIKTSLSEYKRRCKEVTAAGTKKARQAWYELAIRDGLSVDIGEAIYYINNGKTKSEADIKRVTHFYRGKEETTKELTREYGLWYKKKGNKDMLTIEEYVKKYHPSMSSKDEIVFNCVRIPNDVIEDEEEHFCDNIIEYNVPKYIDQFNKRIKPLLVCFSEEIRNVRDNKGEVTDGILITSPKDRKWFTEEESTLVSGVPYSADDQDTFERLMVMEDKEISFWVSVGKTPPFANECGIDWEEIVRDYKIRMSDESNI